MKLKFIASLLVAAAFVFVPLACAQKNEVSGVIGRTFIDSQTITGATFTNPQVNFGDGTTVEISYARKVKSEGFWALALEVPFNWNPDEDLNAGTNAIPSGYKAYFITPGVRLNVFAENVVSPWVAFGGGFGHFSSSSQLQFNSGPNTGNTGSTSGVFDLGGGVDFNLRKRWGVRFTARNYWSGVPALNVTTNKTRQSNLFIGMGAFFRF
jgi:hypothetical protein